MQTNNRSPVIETRYVPLEQHVSNLFQNLSMMLYVLHDEGRYDLAEPLAQMLIQLGRLDTDALRAIDAAHE
jgi:hypothetical protein